MKTIPIICTLALVTMSACFMRAWWPIRDMGCDLKLIQPKTLASIAAPTVPRVEIKQPVTTAVAVVSEKEQKVDDSMTIDKKTFDSLLAEVRRLRESNETLRDQLAEMNRDLMQLEFRVDTHSESFRPLPVAEDQIATTSDESSDGESDLLPPLVN